MHIENNNLKNFLLKPHFHSATIRSASYSFQWLETNILEPFYKIRSNNCIFSRERILNCIFNYISAVTKCENFHCWHPSQVRLTRSCQFALRQISKHQKIELKHSHFSKPPVTRFAGKTPVHFLHEKCEYELYIITILIAGQPKH